MSTLFNISDKIKATYLPFDADRFVLLVDSEESGVSGSDQFEITGAVVSTGTTFPVRFSPESDPLNTTDVTVDVSDPTITFPSPGKYFVQIGQPFHRIRFDNGGDKDKLLEIAQWGNILWSNMRGAFFGCLNLIGKAIDVPNLSNVTEMREMFRTSSFNQNISNWDVSNVTEMRDMFRSSSFNQDISSWDVSNVQNMFAMFFGSSFNQNISNWSIDSANNLNSTFSLSSMSCENYTDSLVGWINNAKTKNMPINLGVPDQIDMIFATSRSGGANFADAGEARAFATLPVADGGLGWTITGDTVQTNC